MQSSNPGYVAKIDWVLQLQRIDIQTLACFTNSSDTYYQG